MTLQSINTFTINMKILTTLIEQPYFGVHNTIQIIEVSPKLLFLVKKCKPL